MLAIVFPSGNVSVMSFLRYRFNVSDLSQKSNRSFFSPSWDEVWIRLLPSKELESKFVTRDFRGIKKKKKKKKRESERNKRVIFVNGSFIMKVVRINQDWINFFSDIAISIR